MRKQNSGITAPNLIKFVHVKVLGNINENGNEIEKLICPELNSD